MISQLSIKDFAIIKNLQAEFKTGLNILTGETGAGKSIIIEAISLALGSRADTTYIRTGCEKAVIQLVIDLPTEDEPIILSREILATGKSICRINDQIVTRGHMSEFCQELVDIHGQYDHQSLLNPENHLALLDACAKETIAEKKVRVIALYENYLAIQKELTKIKQMQSEGERKHHFLAFELAEITAVNPILGEDEELSGLLSVLQNSEKIFQKLSLSYDSLYDREDSVASLLGTVIDNLNEISPYSPTIAAFFDSINDCYYKLEDVSLELSKFKNNIDFAPEKIDEAIGRLDAIERLKKKYGGSIESVLAHKSDTEKQLHLLEDFDQILKERLNASQQAYEALSTEALHLSDERKKMATIIEQLINQELEQLHFKDANFHIQFQQNVDPQGQYQFSEHGIDTIEFMISTNKGEALKPLAKIASGGEISRIMLAFKRILGDYDHIPTMVFDEIDSGISGQAAGVVGIKLAQIAKTHQILCITHLPQIAVMGDSHFRIAKYSDQEQTYTTIEPMSSEEKITEIARLSGSIQVTPGAFENAKELIALAEQTKKQF